MFTEKNFTGQSFKIEAKGTTVIEKKLRDEGEVYDKAISSIKCECGEPCVTLYENPSFANPGKIVKVWDIESDLENIGMDNKVSLVR